MILEKIKEPKDLRRLSKKELDILAGEIRKFIIEKTGGIIKGGPVLREGALAYEKENYI